MKYILIIFALLFLLGCSSPTETIVIEIFTVIEPLIISEDVMISPLGGIIPVTPKWNEGLPILRGKIVNLSEDTLYNKRMRFIITVRNQSEFILSSTYGYMTFDTTKFAYFPEYPYKIEHDLAPGKMYNIYVVGDTLDLSISNHWWFKLEDGD